VAKTPAPGFLVPPGTEPTLQNPVSHPSRKVIQRPTSACFGFNASTPAPAAMQPEPARSWNLVIDLLLLTVPRPIMPAQNHPAAIQSAVESDEDDSNEDEGNARSNTAEPLSEDEGTENGKVDLRDHKEPQSQIDGTSQYLIHTVSPANHSRYIFQWSNRQALSRQRRENCHCKPSGKGRYT
jgi:hypothetical protein